MNSIPCDIVLLPNPLLAKLAISTSQELERFDSLFTLEDGKFFPHVSLYMCQLSLKSIPRIEEQLSAISHSMSALQLEAYRYDHSKCYIDAEYKKFPELVGIQEGVIKAVNPIREGMREKDVDRMKEAEGLALKNFQDYGYKYIGELFRPHLTLTRLKAENLKSIEELDDVSRFSGVFLKLGLFEMGDNGTAVRKLAEFELGSSSVR